MSDMKKLKRLRERLQEDPRGTLESINRELSSPPGIQPAEKIQLTLGKICVLIEQSQLSEARKLLDHSFGKSIVRENSSLQTQMLILLGVIFHFTGRYDRAMESLMEASRKAQSLAIPDLSLEALIGMSEVFLDIGETSEAASILEKARDLSKKNPDGSSMLEARLFTDHGILFHLVGATEDSQDSFLRAIQLAQSRSNHLEIARIRISQGLTNLDRDPNGAMEEILLGLEFFQTQGIGMGIAHGKLALGQALIRLEEFDKAEEGFLEAFETSRKLGNYFLSSQAARFLGELRENQGDLPGALHFFKLYHEILEEMRGQEVRQLTFGFDLQQKWERSQSEANQLRLRSRTLQKQTEDLFELYQRLRLINGFGQKIAGTLDIKTLGREIKSLLSRPLPLDAVLLGIWRSGDGSLEIAYNSSKVSIDQSLTEKDSGEDLIYWCAKHRQELVARDLREDYPKYTNHGPLKSFYQKYHGAIIHPLSLKGKPTGVLAIFSEKIDLLDQKHLALVESLSPFVQVALRNCRQLEQVKRLGESLAKEKSDLEEANSRIIHLANHDDLTSLANRRLLGEVLDREISSAKRNQEGFGVFYFDLDGFKPVNDQFGHGTGDLVLKELADRLGIILRESDFISRVGGDEFVVLAKGQDRESLQIIAAKILEEISRPLEIQDKVIELSGSLGIAVFPEDAGDRDTLISLADRAMYNIKKSGKNAFRFYSENS